MTTPVLVRELFESETLRRETGVGDATAPRHRLCTERKLGPCRAALLTYALVLTTDRVGSDFA